MNHYQPNPIVIRLEADGHTSRATLRLACSMGDLARPESISDEVSQSFYYY
jgi:hypothetical protein